MTGLLCYVLGCHDRGQVGQVRSVRHAAFGLVTSCASHDPNRYDAGQALGGQVRPVVAPAGQVRPGMAGGRPVAVTRPAPTLSPAGQAVDIRF